MKGQTAFGVVYGYCNYNLLALKDRRGEPVHRTKFSTSAACRKSAWHILKCERDVGALLVLASFTGRVNKSRSPGRRGH